MQQNLFQNNTNTSKSAGLVIAKSNKKTLTKNQIEFNKLTQKIEKLQKEIEKKKLQFDAALKMYGNDIHPTQTEINKERRSLIILLWDVYKRKSFSKNDQRHLKEIVRHNLQIFIDEQETMALDETMSKIFKELEGISFDDMMNDEKEEARKEMERMFKQAKFDVDLSDIDIADSEAMAKLMANAHQQMAEKEERDFEKQQKRDAKKKKTAKQIEYEKLETAAEEMKSKNISTIYKQLAKLFHPDLEQDEERKAEKVILMQELTAAYEAKNLHALLSLELKWIHNENDHLESLTDEKLAVYLQILKEQAKELDYEKNTVFQHPQYSALVEKFGMTISRNPLQTTLAYFNELKEYVTGLKRDLKDFQSANALKYIKEIIKDWKNKDDEYGYDEDEIFRMLFGNR
jgi:hypothetical protein